MAPFVGRVLVAAATATVVGGAALGAVTGNVPDALMSLVGLVAVAVG